MAEALLTSRAPAGRPGRARETVELTTIDDVLSPVRERHAVPWSSERTLEDYVPKGMRSPTTVVQYNGRVVRLGLLRRIRPVPGDRVVVAQAPAGPTVAAFLAIPAWGQSLIIGGAITGLTFAAQTLLRPTPPTLRADDPLRGIGSGFKGVGNTVGAGESIPFGYGETLVAGHIIESYEAPHFDIRAGDATVQVSPDTIDAKPADLNVRVAIAGHQIRSIEEIKIDGNRAFLVGAARTEKFLGTRDQVGPEGFDETRAQFELAGGAGEIISQAAGPVTHAISGFADRFDLKLFFPSGLFEIDSNGDAIDRSITLRIQYRSRAGGAWLDLLPDLQITNARTSAFAFWIASPRLSRDEYEVRVTRLTADLGPAETTKADEVRLDSVVRVLTGRRSHPNLASFTIRQMPVTEGFGGVPRTYTCVAKLKRKVRVYTDPDTYTEAWTDNTAWCTADFITDPIDGLGEFFSYSDINIPEFIAWAQWNDTQTPDGFGSTHKRNTFNFLFQQTIPAEDVLEMLMRAGEAWVRFDGDQWRAVIDRPEEPVTVLTEGEYDPGSLAVASEDDKFRPAIVRGHFVNRLKDWSQDSLPVLDKELTAQTHVGRRMPTRVNVLGIDHPERVNRLLYRALLANRYETDTVQFKAGIEALPIEVGRVFGLASKALGHLSTGRLTRVASDRRRLTLEDAVELDPAKSYEITVVRAVSPSVTGTAPKRAVKAIVEIEAGHYQQMVRTSDGVWPWPIAAGDSYAVAEVGESEDLYRAIEVKVSDRLEVTVRGVRYDERVYDVPALDLTNPEQLEDSFEPTPFESDQVPGPVTNFGFRVENLSPFGASVWVYYASWNPPATGIVASYQVWVKRTTETTWRLMRETQTNSFRIAAVEAALVPEIPYEARVVAVSPIGRRIALADAPTFSFTVNL